MPAQLISKLMEIIIKLIGLYRHVSTHAAGLVISNSLLQKNIPIIWDEANQIGNNNSVELFGKCWIT